MENIKDVKEMTKKEILKERIELADEYEKLFEKSMRNWTLSENQKYFFIRGRMDDLWIRLEELNCTEEDVVDKWWDTKYIV